MLYSRLESKMNFLVIVLYFTYNLIQYNPAWKHTNIQNTYTDDIRFVSATDWIINFSVASFCIGQRSLAVKLYEDSFWPELLLSYKIGEKSWGVKILFKKYLKIKRFKVEKIMAYNYYYTLYDIWDIFNKDRFIHIDLLETCLQNQRNLIKEISVYIIMV